MLKILFSTKQNSANKISRRKKHTCSCGSPPSSNVPAGGVVVEGGSHGGMAAVEAAETFML